MSLNPVAPDIRAVVAPHLDELRRYPDPGRATAALAEAIGVEVDQLVVTNGGSEAIALAARLIGGGVAAEPEFGLHPRSEQGPRWRSNPHNPTGSPGARRRPGRRVGRGLLPPGNRGVDPGGPGPAGRSSSVH